MYSDHDFSCDIRFAFALLYLSSLLSTPITLLPSLSATDKYAPVPISGSNTTESTFGKVVLAMISLASLVLCSQSSNFFSGRLDFIRFSNSSPVLNRFPHLLSCEDSDGA